MNHGWQSESTDGPKGGWGLLSFSLFHLITYLPIYLSNVYLSIYLTIYRSIDLSIYLSLFHLITYLSIYLSLYLSVFCLSVCLSLSLYLSVFCLSVCLSIYLQAWKRSCSARLPQFLHLTTSKTKQFCETSSLFEVDNTKNETILRDVLQKWKIECKADGLVPMRFAIFPVHLSKVLRLPRKSDARSYYTIR